MYIGPQGIVHGTTITILNTGRKISDGHNLRAQLIVSYGLSGMSGAQPRADSNAGWSVVIARANLIPTRKQYEQRWVDEIISDSEALADRVETAKAKGEVVSIAYQGNVVDVWEKFHARNIFIDLGSDQTSLHNPWAGGYFP